MQRIPWKFDGISGTKCRSLAQSIRTRPTHHGISGGSFLALERVIGNGRHWVRPHWLAASGQLGRSRLMTSRDRVLATTIVFLQLDFYNVVIKISIGIIYRWYLTTHMRNISGDKKKWNYRSHFIVSELVRPPECFCWPVTRNGGHPGSIWQVRITCLCAALVGSDDISWLQRASTSSDGSNCRLGCIVLRVNQTWVSTSFT